jgi:asparagine synthase (glutamine-hydrolysing)
VCGLFGVVDAPPGLLDAALVRRLLSLLDHRGPDDRGWLALAGGEVRTGSEVTDLAGEVVLLHTRLSILDLSSAGHQPMSTPDGRFHLSFNGEIYNYLELRDELESLGHDFASGTDTEVLLAAWSEWEAEALGRLVGMFAFALVDAERRVLVLARDHFGIKPLYYAPQPGRFAFASEIPPLLEVPGVARRANPQRVYDYLRWSLLDHGRDTMFAGIRQVQPGHWVELPLDAPERPAERPYWQLEPEQLGDVSLEEAAGRLRDLYLESVRIHLRSDVPVGCAFSGGIDSSANVSAMRFLSGDELKLHTFSYLPEDPELSEKRWIDLLVHQVGAISHAVTPTAEELRADLDRLIAVQGEPFNDTSIYAQYRVFQLTRGTQVKVMLDGQGADELFAGYRGYLAGRLAGLLRRGRLRAAGRLLSALSEVPGAAAGGVAARALGRSLPETFQPLARRFLGEPSVPDWIDGDWLQAHAVTLGDPRTAFGAHALREQRLESVRTGLRELLRYEDRNSMASSIESRVPFLTPGIAQFAAGLPDEYLIALDGTSKVALRQSLRGLVPDEILDRRDKIGFVTPTAAWLGGLGDWVDDVLASESARAAGPICLEQARRRWRDMRDARRPFDPVAWRWVNLSRWADQLEVQFEH